MFDLDLRSADIYEGIFCLPTEAVMNDFDRVCRRLKIAEGDKEEILYQIVDSFRTADDEETISALSHLPNPNGMQNHSYVSGFGPDAVTREVLPTYMESEDGERALKDVICHLGMEIHNQLKLNGFYDPANQGPNGLNIAYRCRMLNDLVIVKLRN